jgi:outer membrane immunogenic protein
MHILEAESMVRYVLLLGLLSSTSALAADIAVQSEQIAVQPEQSEGEWNGAYVGAFLGSISSDGKSNRGAFQGALLTLDVQNGLFPATIDNMTTRFSGGLSAGLNRQYGRFVTGVEADVTFSDLNSVSTFSRVDPNPNPPFTGLDTNTSYQTQFGAIGTARLRGGFSFGRTMVFASAGAAVAKVRNRFTLDLPGLGYSSPGWSTEGTKWGYAVGVGVEHRFTDRIGVKVEALHVDLEDTVVNAADNTTFPGETIDYHFNNQALLGRLGVYVAF